MTPVGRGIQIVPEGIREGLLAGLAPAILVSLPLIGLLMVSRVRYAHAAAILLGGPTRFPVLVKFVFVGGALYLAPVPVLFLTAVGYVGGGLVRHLLEQRRSGGTGAGPRRAA